MRKNNETMEVMTDLSLEFWLNNGTLNQVLGMTIRNCEIFFTLNKSTESTPVNLYNQIQSFDFGEIIIDYSALVNVSNLAPNHSNFDLNMEKIRQYLDSIKPVITFGLNKFLEKQ